MNMSDEPVTLPPKTALASVHLAMAILNELNLDRAPVNEEVVYSKSKVDVSEIDFNEMELTKAQRAEVKGLLKCISHALVSGDKDLGCAHGVEHEIHLTDDLPFKEPYHRVPPGQLDEFQDAICDLLDAGVITKSKSPYTSPMVLVKKDKAQC